jgi:TPR repeat protein
MLRYILVSFFFWALQINNVSLAQVITNQQKLIEKCVIDKRINQIEYLNNITSPESLRAIAKIYDLNFYYADKFIDTTSEIISSCFPEKDGDRFDVQYLSTKIKSIEKTLNYTMFAVKAGSIDAIVDLAAIYQIGAGVPRDFNEAKHLALSAAEAGNAEGQRLLATLYWQTDKSVISKMNQYMWYNIAAVKIAEAAKDRDVVAQDMVQSDILNAQQASTNCIRRNFKSCEIK